MTKKNIKFMDMAGELAELSTYTIQPIGCVVTYKNHVISTGFNNHKTHPLQKFYNSKRTIKHIPDSHPHKLHAEIDALLHVRHLIIDWSKVNVYIYRKRKDIKHGLARPCESCMSFIKDMGIRNIFYTTDDGYVEEYLDY